ncbi:MAG: hypothetical protein JRJ12_11630 [Deltaproteobacteria bacterium]|nr:hypothetical protein [Deltaproteobacteria bacterium]MBW2072540.1 hypothetical protein [Deltaproteobacteria bacterium]
MDGDKPVNFKPSLRLPRDLKNRILTDQRLSLHQKFVLFTLYYLDSKGKLAQYRSYVPRFLNLCEDDFQENIDELVRYNYLSMDQENLSLNIRPIRYFHA